jgi:hypothetical protein
MGALLGKRSAQDLRKLASGHGVVIPSSFNDAEAIMDTIHDALSAKSSASASGAGSVHRPGASPDRPSARAPEAEPRLSVLCCTGRSQLWKFGFQFTAEWQSVAKDQFTDEQWRVLSMDRRVRVRQGA